MTGNKYLPEAKEWRCKEESGRNLNTSSEKSNKKDKRKEEYYEKKISICT